MSGGTAASVPARVTSVETAALPAQSGLVLQQNGPNPITEILLRFVPAGSVLAELARLVGPAIAFVVAFLAVLLVGRAVLVPLLNRILGARGLSEHAKRPLLKVANIALLFASVAVAFGFAGFRGFLTALATIGAAATLAVGFAMQDVIANFVAGVFIFTDRPFRIGDWIEWDDNSGVVEDISFRVTRVRTFDNELLTVPNSQLTDNVIKNPVAKDRLRLQVTFGIGYEDDVARATEIIVEEAERHPDVLDEPEPSVRVTELADSYVGLTSRIWIANPSRADFVKTRSEYVRDVKARFDEAGIEIPFPQRDLSGQVEMVAPPEYASAN